MSNTDDTQQQWHLLDFFCDDEGSCALTVFANRSRFHVIADASKLNEETIAGKEYHECVRSIQRHQSGSEYSEQGNKHKDGDSDSGVDVSEPREEVENSDKDSLDPEEALQDWMMLPLADVIYDRESPPKSSEPLSIQDWYHAETRFYNLDVTQDGKKVKAVELESDSDLEERIQQLLPQATLPKYITHKLSVPRHHASDYDVLEASDQPPGTPYHPCRVRHRKTNRTYFLKVVDNKQPQATKREIDVLHRIDEHRLHEQLHAPKLEATISFHNENETPAGKKKIMGFLLSEIPDPTPLTTKLRSDVPQKKRDRWAKEVERVKDLLHKSDIVWGDAKADNFVIDSDGKLWIIDFGGGYTEGWIDPHLNETMDGDDLGTEKIVNGLKDPDANVCAPDEEATKHETANGPSRGSRKRSREESGDSEGVNEQSISNKRRRS